MFSGRLFHNMMIKGKNEKVRAKTGILSGPALQIVGP